MLLNKQTGEGNIKINNKNLDKKVYYVLDIQIIEN